MTEDGERGGEMTEVDERNKKGGEKNTIFTASASVSEQKEHFMLSSSPSLRTHLQKTAGQWSKEVRGALTSAGFTHSCVRTPDTEGRGQINQGGLWPREEGGRGGSLLFAGGELADLAGCGDSFT